ncbi:tyrosine-type recombinase/integrase [Psychromarinibacter sp. C21-152]|uniref:Tyrosine-type recombinase/integrase n=1 Tax=Psychromarinibacter sediminicola TaxID=3033385 RepID=A0AAE3NTG2_9RHOB|nr:site-specific integrase [Psychromarinibacter sediminicola]MDF0602119.1 tyrosine-type recombinase/integrase [Psychromarinibacter sediminicola]
MSLTEAQISKVQPTGKTQKLYDGSGLYLEVRPSGMLIWRIACRVNRKPKTVTLGDYPKLKLRAARIEAMKVLDSINSGLDPSAPPGEPDPLDDFLDFSGEEVDPRDTWRGLCEDWFEKRLREGIADLTQKKTLILLAKTYPGIGNKRARDLGLRDFVPILQAEADAGRLETAKRLRSVCSAVLRYGVQTDRADRDFMHEARDVTPAPQVRNRPGLTDPRQVGSLMQALRDYSGSPQTRAALLIQAYCFQRPGETRTMEWADLDLDAALWTIPAEKMKRKRPHIVPLARQVVEVIDWIRPVTMRSKWVLPMGRDWGRPLSEATMNQALVRLGFEKSEHVPHGFRTTASTMLYEHEWNGDWIELQLSHVEDNKVKGAYNKALHLKGRTEMMQWYADHLDQLAEE